MPYLNQFKDINGDTVYPVTVSGGVYVSGTKTLDAALNDKMDKSGHSTNRVLTTDGNGDIITSTITASELSTLAGIDPTPIQAQIDNINTIATARQPKLYVKAYRLGTNATPLSYVIGDNGRVKVDNIFYGVDYDTTELAHGIPADATIYSVQCTDIRGYIYPYSLIYLDADYIEWGNHKGDIIIQGFPNTVMEAWHMPSAGLTITSIRLSVVYSLS